MYENLTVGRPTTHFSLEKSYRQKCLTVLQPEIVHFSRPPALNSYAHLVLKGSYQKNQFLICYNRFRADSKTYFHFFLRSL